MTDCQTAQEHILDSLDHGQVSDELAVHVADCPPCAEFAATHASLDARLTRMLAPPRLSAEFRSTLRRTIAAETRPWLRDALPDLFHFLSWGVATTACAAFLSLDPMFVIVGGAAAALSTYLLLTLVRSTLEEA